MDIWDGRRPRSPRSVLARQELSAAGLGFRYVAEAVDTPTDWCFREPHHVLVVHRRGELDSMELEFEDGPAGRVLPRVGDVWVIPAEQSYAALARGSVVTFCEITVPARVLGSGALRSRVGHRDPLLHGLVERLAGLVVRDDAISGLLRDSIAETVRLHVADGYVEGARKPRRTGELDTTMQRKVADYLDDSLDEDVTLAKLASVADMAVADLLPAFKAAFGTTPHQFLLDRRIARAKTLLTGPTTITDIAHAVGFSTPSHFAATFRQRVGVTPSAYRASFGR